MDASRPLTDVWLYQASNWDCVCVGGWVGGWVKKYNGRYLHSSSLSHLVRREKAHLVMISNYFLVPIKEQDFPSPLLELREGQVELGLVGKCRVMIWEGYFQKVEKGSVVLERIET